MPIPAEYSGTSLLRSRPDRAVHSDHKFVLEIEIESKNTVILS